MHILVLNSGSSTLKFQVFFWPQEQPMLKGTIDRIGESSSLVSFEGKNFPKTQFAQTIEGHGQAFEVLSNILAERKLEGIQVIGHRVVHGAERFSAPTLITSEVLDEIRKLCPLAPLHNPANLLGIEACLTRWPNLPQVAIFDTAFHHSIPEEAFRYAIPADLYFRYHVRRYGFHGTSHAYVAKQACEYLRIPAESANFITLHLGNGASACAIRGGKSVDVSLGFTPLEGLVMGTRSGDIDPAIPFFLAREANIPWAEVEKLLNTQSGLKGLCGANDMRDIEARAAQGDKQATLALNVFCYRIRKYVGAYATILGRLDALIFTGGIGENSATVRSQVCSQLEILGIRLDPQANQERSSNVRSFHAAESRSSLLVVPTNEELAIAEHCVELLKTK